MSSTTSINGHQLILISTYAPAITAWHEKAAHLSAGAPAATVTPRRGVLLVAGSGGAAAAAADLRGRANIAHCVQVDLSLPPAGCGSV